MELTKKTYKVRRATLEVLLEILDDNQLYTADDGKVYTIPSVANAMTILEAELSAQEDEA